MAITTLFVCGLGVEKAHYEVVERMLRQASREEFRYLDITSLQESATSMAQLQQMLAYVWQEENFPRSFRALDVVVIGAMGVVLRDFLSAHFDAKTTPIYRLVMIAVPHFGVMGLHHSIAALGYESPTLPRLPSTLAPQIYRELSTANVNLFERTLRDRVGKEQLYKETATLATHFVATTPASIRTFGQEASSDGWIRSSSANMATTYVTWEAGNVTVKSSKGLTGFALLEHEDMTSLLYAPHSPMTTEFIKEALQVDDSSFGLFCKKLARISDATLESGVHECSTHGFAQLLFRLRDAEGESVDRYDIVFAWDEEAMGRFFFHEALRHSDKESHHAGITAWYIDMTALLARLHSGVQIGVVVHPARQKSGWGYETDVNGFLPLWRWSALELRRFLRPNQTTLIDIVLPPKAPL
ncbi:MAG: hypothetical protein KU37_09405 [Sulfuricurvum sp. PC08-66]|nr:MAG: hypothetical protein KU37_09405 [Sulfuricurvum sp. PC08-66]